MTRSKISDRSVTAFAPATVSNVACGFDVLGFPLELPGDEVEARFGADETASERETAGSVTSAASAVSPVTPVTPITIDVITGDGGRLPRDPMRNTASVAAQALLTALGERRPIALTIRKGLPLSSGLGGSAASAVAAVVAVDGLLSAHAPIETLLACALRGEGLGAGGAHPDNVAPCLYGGLVLVRHPSPPDIIRLPVPAGLTAVVVHPDLEVETARARALLGSDVPLKAAIQQWANLAALVDGLHRSDFAQISRSLEDTIAEPRRAPLIPGLAEIKRAATDAGALGCSLSGSGPSIFALCRKSDADRVAKAMTAAVRREIGGESETYVSAITDRGARLVSTCAS
jgi:homoserine kinase